MERDVLQIVFGNPRQFDPLHGIKIEVFFRGIPRKMRTENPAGQKEGLVAFFDKGPHYIIH